MKSSINLHSHTIDLSTLEELRDPNLISRYPPLFQRKQNLIALDNSTKSIKRSKTVSTPITTNNRATNLTPIVSAPTSNYYQVQSTHTLNRRPCVESKESISNKRHRFVKFWKNISAKSNKMSRHECLIQSISKPVDYYCQQQQQHQPALSPDTCGSIFLNSLYPSKSRNTINIKPDDRMSYEDGRGYDMNNSTSNDNDGVDNLNYHDSEFDLSRRNTYISQMKFQPMSPPQELSAVNSIVIPPVGGSNQIDNPEEFASPIIHPNIHLEQQRQQHEEELSKNKNNNFINKYKHDPKFNSGHTRIPHHSTISFAKYDLMNLDTSAMSPIETPGDDDDEEEEELITLNRGDFILPNSSFFIPTTTTSIVNSDTDSHESYYSFSKSPETTTTNNNNNNNYHSMSTIVRGEHVRC